jgi:hypothetical protein
LKFELPKWCALYFPLIIWEACGIWGPKFER